MRDASMTRGRTVAGARVMSHRLIPVIQRMPARDRGPAGHD